MLLLLSYQFTLLHDHDIYCQLRQNPNPRKRSKVEIHFRLINVRFGWRRRESERHVNVNAPLNRLSLSSSHVKLVSRALLIWYCIKCGRLQQFICLHGYVLSFLSLKRHSRLQISLSFLGRKLGDKWSTCRRKSNNKAIKKEKGTKFKKSPETNLASDSSSWGITKDKRNINWISAGSSSVKLDLKLLLKWKKNCLK